MSHEEINDPNFSQVKIRVSQILMTKIMHTLYCVKISLFI